MYALLIQQGLGKTLKGRDTLPIMKRMMNLRLSKSIVRSSFRNRYF